MRRFIPELLWYLFYLRMVSGEVGLFSRDGYPGLRVTHIGHHLTLSDVKKNIVLENDIHFAPTKIVALENTLNGTIFPQEDIVEISKFAHENNVKMHLDGARIWHVAAETGTHLRVLCEPFDSVSLCFSKGLGM